MPKEDGIQASLFAMRVFLPKGLATDAISSALSNYSFWIRPWSRRPKENRPEDPEVRQAF